MERVRTREKKLPELVEGTGRTAFSDQGRQVYECPLTRNSVA
jgi:hypothetical protein